MHAHDNAGGAAAPLGLPATVKLTALGGRVLARGHLAFPTPGAGAPRYIDPSRRACERCSAPPPGVKIQIRMGPRGPRMGPLGADLGRFKGWGRVLAGWKGLWRRCMAMAASCCRWRIWLRQWKGEGALVAIQELGSRCPEPLTRMGAGISTSNSRHRKSCQIQPHHTPGIFNNSEMGQAGRRNVPSAPPRHIVCGGSRPRRTSARWTGGGRVGDRRPPRSTDRIS